MFSTILLVLASIGILKALPFDARDNIRVVNPGEALDSPVVSTKFGNWQGSSIGGVGKFDYLRYHTLRVHSASNQALLPVECLQKNREIIRILFVEG